ncbi:MAG: metal ABC transporter permease, partial [Alphaproteobacteria bacterium]|nr:metal ABC transporter permease [Alphaproteobacteria bacterium]
MSSPHSSGASSNPPRPIIKAESSLYATTRMLMPYIWPKDRPDLRWRVMGAVGLLLLGKLVTIAVPYSFKWATDALSPDAHDIPLPAILAGPIVLTVIYGFLRSFMQFFTQARDALFAAVSMFATRKLAS